MKSSIQFFFISILYLNLRGQSPSSMKFIENKGQWDSSVKYRVDVPGGKLFAQKNSFTYLFYDAKKLGELHHPHIHPGEEKTKATNEKLLHTLSNPDEKESAIRMHAFRITMIGANTESIIPSQKASEHFNFYQGADQSKWASGAKAFQEIVYKNIYPHIDMRWYEYGGTLKYEFTVFPGGDPKQIQLQYEGVDDISLKNGHLLIETSVNTILEKAPYLFQLVNGKEQKINGQFALSNHVLSFDIKSPYNKNIPLILDPQLIFSTYSGSYADNWGNTAAFDTLGYMYSGGTVFDVGFPSTLGEIYNGNSFSFDGVDVGILKYSPDGKNLIYGTYVGGFYNDVPYSLVVNNKNELIITGTTSSSDFPVSVGAYSTTFIGGPAIYPISGLYYRFGSDLFVSKLDINGFYSAGTFVGGSNNEGIQIFGESLTQNYGDQLRGDVIVDDSNNVYVVSNTRSTNFPVSAGAYQPSLMGGKDGCVFKLSADFTTLKWSTYLGGTSEDALYSIQVDSLHGVYVSGGTTSFNYPVTGSVYQTAASGGIDGMVSHLNNKGTILLHSSYIGTPYYDQAYFVQIDKNENVYLFGQTKGLYPVSTGVYSNFRGGQFIHSLKPDLSSTRFSTTIGSSQLQPNISPTAFLVNDCGNIFLSGWGGILNEDYVGGTTNNLPTTTDAFRSVSDGSDFYIMVLSANAQSLLYGTFFGAYSSSNPLDHVDGGTSRFDKKGIIYEAVCAGCGSYNTFPTTPGAYSNTNNSDNCNNASFKFDLNNLVADFTVEKTISCDSYKVIITNTSSGGKTFEWDFGDGKTYSGTNPGEHIYADSGNYIIRLIATDLTTCIGKDTVYKSVFVPPILPINITPKDTTICKGDTTQLFTKYDSTYHYQWTPSDSLSDDTIHNPLAYPSKTTFYTVTITDTFNCVASKRIRVTVIDVKPEINFTNVSDCSGKLAASLQNNTMGVYYNWIFGDGTSEDKGRNLVIHEYAKPGTYTVYLNASKEACSFSDSVTFTLEKVFLPNLVTPNSDGKNDVYEIKGKTNNWKFEVYNRWGDLVYKNEDYNNEWFGDKLSDGVYYYLITSPNETKCKGWVQLLR